MSIASDRLATYLAAETSILTELGQEMRQDSRLLRQADLREVRAQIDKLRAEVAAENQAQAGRSGPAFLVADFSGRGRG